MMKLRGDNMFRVSFCDDARPLEVVAFRCKHIGGAIVFDGLDDQERVVDFLAFGPGNWASVECIDYAPPEVIPA